MNAATRRVFSWTFAAVLATALTACRHQVREPRYDRRPLSEWARDLGDRNQAVNAAAVRALVESSDDGVPFAIEALGDPDWLARQNALRAAFLLSGKDPNRAVDAMALRLEDPDPRVREEAARKLHDLVVAAQEALARRQAEGEEAEGPNFRDETGDMIPLPDWPEVRPALPRLAAALADTSEEVRSRAAWALAWSGRDGPAAGPALESLLDDPSFAVRLGAASALALGGRDRSREVVPTSLFREALAEWPQSWWFLWQDQYQVPLALAALDPHGKDTVPLLAEIARASSSQVADSMRLGSMAALGNLGPLAKEAIPSLEEAAADENWKDEAQAALKRIRGD